MIELFPGESKRVKVVRQVAQIRIWATELTRLNFNIDRFLLDFYLINVGDS